MIFRRFATLKVIVVALLVTAGAFKASAGEGNKLEARIEIFGFAGLHMLTNRTTIEEAANRYAIAVDLDNRGLAVCSATRRSGCRARTGPRTKGARRQGGRPCDRCLRSAGGAPPCPR